MKTSPPPHRTTIIFSLVTIALAVLGYFKVSGTSFLNNGSMTGAVINTGAITNSTSPSTSSISVADAKDCPPGLPIMMVQSFSNNGVGFSAPSGARYCLVVGNFSGNGTALQLRDQVPAK